MGALLAKEVHFRSAIDSITRRRLGWVLCLTPMRPAQLVVLESLYMLWDQEVRPGVMPRITLIDNEPASDLERSRLKDIDALVLGAESMDLFVGARPHLLCDERGTDVLATAGISSLSDIGACLKAVHDGKVVVSRILARQAADGLDLIRNSISTAAQRRLAASPFKDYLTQECLQRTPIHLVWRESNSAMRAWSVVTNREDMAALLTTI